MIISAQICNNAKFDKDFIWIIHLNIQGGLINKKNYLEIILSDSNISIVCLNEHWLQKDNVYILNSIPNYNLTSFYCR